MSKKNLLDNQKGRLFKPKIYRSESKASGYIQNPKSSDISKNSFLKNTNIESTASFRYGDKKSIVSTQQLKIDWSKFENHTFFNSAVANVNESFDKIVNFYPFEKSLKSIESYEDDLTGFERYVLEKFPKNVGYLNFSGTQVGESLSNGTQISVVDKSGASIAQISDKTTGQPVLDPRFSPFSVDFFIKVPEQINDNQVVIQKFGSLANNFTLALSSSNSTNSCEVHFAITSGSNYAIVSGSLEKGSFSHIYAMYDLVGDQRAKLLINDNIHSSSQETYFKNLNYNNSDLTLGVGQSIRLGADIFTNKQTFSGSIDEIKYFHAVDPIKDVKKRKRKTFYRSDDDNSLKLHYRFNEPYGIYTGNNILLDASGNSLHSVITNFTVNDRLTGSDVPVAAEDINRSPVLFPSFPSVTALNANLLTTASLYDDYNPNLITKLVPRHYFQSATDFRDYEEELARLENNFETFSSNHPGKNISEIPELQLLIKLLLSYSKYFDELKLLIDSVTSYRITDYDDFDTTPDPLLEEKAKILNVTLPDIFSSGQLEQVFEGINLTDAGSKSAKSLIEIKNLIWRRIISAAPRTNLSRGTLEALKSPFRSAGIEPDNILTFREFGGSKIKSLDASRELKRDVFKFLSFTGTKKKKTTSVGSQGYPVDIEIPKIKSSFLSGSRIQVGHPKIRTSKATTTITIGTSATTTGLLADGDTVTIVDFTGTATTFTLKNAGTSAATGLAVMATNTVANALGSEIATAIAAIINSTTGMQVAALAISNTVLLTQDNVGPAGNQLAPTEVSAGANNVTGSAFSGGSGFEKRNNNFFHGISSSPSDGLFTSGSFTYEALYDWESGYRNTPESLIRLHTTGTSNPSSAESAIINLVASNDYLRLYFKDSTSKTTTNMLHLTGLNVFDKDTWYVSFGKKNSHDLDLTGTSSFFLRAAKQLNGDVISQYYTASFFEENSDSVFKNVSGFNTSGSFLVIGSQSLQNPGGANLFLNGASVDNNAKITNFHGCIANARFFSKDTDLKEFNERAKNYDSYGVDNPHINYSFTDLLTGSFERLILRTDAKQSTTETNSSGEIRLFDFSQNNFHFEGSNFETNKNVFKNLRVDFEILSDKFDLNYTREKVRIRSFQDAENIKEGYFSSIAPIHEILPSEESLDDNRLSVDMSVMKGLNENILRMFSDLSSLEDAFGNPNLIFGESYPDARQLREVYFNNVLEPLNLQKYRELFKWIDNSFTDVLYSLMPRTTNFLGVNFIYESHVLERNRFRYLYDEIYMKSIQRSSNTGNLFLSQFVAKVKKH